MWIEDAIQPHLFVGPLDVHPSQDAIVVHYDVEAIVLNEYGEPAVADRKSAQKVINVKGLSANSETAVLARELVTRCELIDPVRLPEVEQLLVYLQNRQSSGRRGSAEESLTRPGGDGEARTRGSFVPPSDDIEEPLEKATLADLEAYMELLYEELPSKVKGTGMILQLARIPDNLQELAVNEALLLALTRVFREDWKKSLDLTVNIVYIFFCFSTFSQFHKLIIHHKVGSLCMSVLEHEIKRHTQLTEDMEAKRREAKADSTSSVAKLDYEKSRKKCQVVLHKQETLLRVVLYLLLNLAEDVGVELKMVNKGIPTMLMSLLDRRTPELLIMAVTFLKKLSIYRENLDEMALQHILKKLIRLIPHEHEILLNMTLRLLLNLSFDGPLCEAMVKEGLLPKLVALLGNESERVLVLCILYHVSIMDKCKPMFSLTDCISTLMQMILHHPEELVEPEVVALGINLACHPLNAQQMVRGPGLKLLVKRAVRTGDPLLLKMIRNISQHEDGGMKRMFLDFIPDFGSLVQLGHNDELVLEALGILGNLTMADLNYLKIVEEFQLVPFIGAKLSDPRTEDDILLEVVILLGTLAIDESTAGLLANEGIIEQLIGLLRAKQEDDELVLQVVYVFYQLTTHSTSRSRMIADTRIPSPATDGHAWDSGTIAGVDNQHERSAVEILAVLAISMYKRGLGVDTVETADYLLELMNDRNKEVSRTCNKALDIIMEHDKEVADKVKMERFRRHNCLWLSIVTGEIPDDSDDVYGAQDDDYLDPYYHLQMVDMLENSDLYYDEPAADPELEGTEVHPCEANRLLYMSPVDVQNLMSSDDAYMYHMT